MPKCNYNGSVCDWLSFEELIVQDLLMVITGVIRG